MNAKDYVAYKKGGDYDPNSMRPGPKGCKSPEFKCFNCGKWIDGNEWRYKRSKAWYPFLKYTINFLCGPKCSLEIYEKHKDKMIKI